MMEKNDETQTPADENMGRGKREYKAGLLKSTMLSSGARKVMFCGSNIGNHRNGSLTSSKFG